MDAQNSQSAPAAPTTTTAPQYDLAQVQAARQHFTDDAVLTHLYDQAKTASPDFANKIDQARSIPGINSTQILDKMKSDYIANNHAGAKAFVQSGTAPGYDGPAPITSVAKNLLPSVGKGVTETAKALVDPLKGGANNVKNIATNVGKDFKDAGQNTAENFKAALDGKKSAFDAGFQAVGDASKAALSPVTETVNAGVGDIADSISSNKGFQNIANSNVAKALSTTANIPSEKYAAWAQQHPEAAKNLEALGNVAALATSVPTGEAAAGLAKEGLDATAEAAKPGLNAVKNDVVTGAGKVADAASNVADRTVGQSAMARDLAKGDAKATQTAIDAVNPDLSGKKLTGAYKDVVTGKRTTTPGGILSGQDVGIDKPTVDLGTRLKDVLTSKDPAKNLQALSKHLSDTENTLTPLLQNDKTPVVKQGLTDTLEGLKTSMPREFQAIKDSKSTFENVIDFAKQKINDAQPNINGLRNARTAFDTQARVEYPSAFKEGGYIDMKTPAGRAIKLARDTINDYAYNTAENGSQIQKLIGKEADIFKATDNIAPKAAALHGETKIGKIINMIKSHPIAAAASAYGADKVIKRVTGVGF